MTCDICHAEIKHDRATGFGDGYVMVYDKESGRWRRVCRGCQKERNDG